MVMNIANVTKTILLTSLKEIQIKERFPKL